MKRFVLGAFAVALLLCDAARGDMGDMGGMDMDGAEVEGGCEEGNNYPLFCSQLEANHASSMNKSHIMVVAGVDYWMPIGAKMYHGDYTGDAPDCACGVNKSLALGLGLGLGLGGFIVFLIIIAFIAKGSAKAPAQLPK